MPFQNVKNNHEQKDVIMQQWVKKQCPFCSKLHHKNEKAVFTTGATINENKRQCGVIVVIHALVKTLTAISSGDVHAHVLKYLFVHFF